MTRKQTYRNYSDLEAYTRVTSLISSLGFSVKMEVAPTYPSACRVDLWKGGKLEATGYGKGSEGEAKVGAYFEALEHFAIHQTNGDLVSFPAWKFRELPSLRQDQVIQLFPDGSKQNLLSRRFQSLGDPAEIVFYPEFLINPEYELSGTLDGNDEIRTLQRYSSNSGTAIGIGTNEALLHGLNEVIERDVLSRFLASSRFADPVQIYLIDQSSLPEELWSLLKLSKEINKKKIELLLISTVDELPTFVAISKSESGPLVYGSGAALSDVRAARRAITELIQTKYILDRYEDIRNNQAVAKSRLAAFPELQHIPDLRWSTIEKMANIKVIDFNDARSKIFPKESLEDFLEVEATLIATYQVAKRHYSNIYHAPIAEFGENIKVARILIPEADRFFLSLAGVAVMPTQRHCRIAR